MNTRTDAIFLSHPTTTRRMWFGERCVEAAAAVAPLVLNPKDHVLDADEMGEIAGGCRAIILDRLTAITPEVLDRLPNLVAVLRSGVDFRRIDIAAASERGVLVTHVKAAYGAAVSELVLGLMLSAARGICGYDAAYHAGRVPAEVAGQQIAGATVGIIGFGAVSRHLAPVLAAMGATVLAFDPYADVALPTASVSLDELLDRSDYVVPLAVATPETRHIIGAAALTRMKPTAWLVNCSRGDLVDENALVAALDRGTIAGAALDVGWAEDQLPSPQVAHHPRVIATPHVGGMTEQSFESQGMQAIEQARLVFQGQIPPGAVNAEAATRLRLA